MIDRALLFAAGRGERMRPLTAHTPKPLLPVGGKRLIEWHLEKLAAAGVRAVVINTAHLAEQFPAQLGRGERWGLSLHYSHEGAEPLETGGGLLHALPLLGDGPFLVVNGDVWCDLDFSALPQDIAGVAHLVLVDNPPQHAQGDFHLDAQGRVHGRGFPIHTYSGIGVYRAAVLDGWRDIVGALPGAALQPPRFPLAPLLFAAAARGDVSGQYHAGRWTDVGTPQRLAELEAQLRGGGASELTAS
ncbi:MAG TPA: nucleotidyltransferase family protein [Rhodanobacteraceae bacterium]|nr:nucleotidyltransferase family protein [Rhodanobacteraceae bacterium]